MSPIVYLVLSCLTGGAAVMNIVASNEYSLIVASINAAISIWNFGMWVKT